MTNKFTGNAFRNKNSYNQLGMVVFKFEELEDPVTKKTKIFATGFDYKNPSQQISVALMEEEGYRKFWGQMSKAKLYEKTGSDGKSVYFKGSVELPSKEAYDKELQTNVFVNEKLQQFSGPKRQAETLATKRDRIRKLPVIMWLDGANHLGTIGNIKVYEAKWISGTDPVTSTHRKVLGNIHIKHDAQGKPYWGEINAVDRINNIQIPTPSMTDDQKNATAIHNRNLLVHALSNNRVTEEGYSSERKPYVSFKLEDKSTGKIANVRIYPEEVSATREKEHDSFVKFEFKRPKAAHETLEAYAYKQDTFSKELNDAIVSGQKLGMGDYGVVEKAYKSDQVRALVSSMIGIPFQPLITQELTNQTDIYELKVDISKKANQLKSLHKKLVIGEVSPMIVSGTTYDVGQKYLKRLVDELTFRRNDGVSKPIGGLVDLIPNPKFNHLATPPLKISGANENNDLIFSELNISLRKHEGASDNSSLFTGLVTTPHQSANEAANGRILFSELTELHSPSVETFRFLDVEFKDYISGAKELSSVVDLIKEERERVSQLSNESLQKQEYSDLYRVLGKHSVPEGITPPSQPVQREHKSPDKDTSPSLDF